MTAATAQKRRPNGTRPDPVRSVRCSDETWEAARRRAAYELVTMSHVLLTFLEGYATGQIDLPKITVVYDRTEEETSTST